MEEDPADEQTEPESVVVSDEGGMQIEEAEKQEKQAVLVTPRRASKDEVQVEVPFEG